MIVAGIGCRALCPPSEIIALVQRAIGVTGGTVSLLAAPAFKCHRAAITEAAHGLAAALIWIDDAQLAGVQALCPTRSRSAASATGFASVAEGCALAGAGSGGRLVLPRIAAARVTCALAQSGAA